MVKIREQFPPSRRAAIRRAPRRVHPVRPPWPVQDADSRVPVFTLHTRPTRKLHGPCSRHRYPARRVRRCRAAAGIHRTLRGDRLPSLQAQARIRNSHGARRIVAADSAKTGRALQGILFGVTPTDAGTYIGVFGLLTAVSLLACNLPARRAADIDPTVASRQE